MTAVLLADDHAIVRKGLRSVVECMEGWRVCAEAANGRDAVALGLQHRPDIVVMDINMPELNGLDATRQLCAAIPGIRVLILSAHDSEQLVREMLSSGARGYVLKADAGEELELALRALVGGNLYFTSSIAEMVMRGLQKSSGPAESPELPARLSPKEREVMQLVAEGKTNKEVAVKLDISVKTVETHRKHIMSKLDLHSMSDLVRYAIQNRIIEV
jgi:DNA-binding NarL/FixJ family response regulator